MTIGATFTFATGLGYSQGAVISTVPVRLTEIEGFNATAGEAYLLLFNATGAIAPATVPDFGFRVPGMSSFSWEPSMGGKQFTTALQFKISSTGDQYTAAAVNFAVFARGVLLG